MSYEPSKRVYEQTIGTCSLCGGRVTLPMVWHSNNTAPPRAKCERCWAVAVPHALPVIQMAPNGTFHRSCSKGTAVYYSPSYTYPTVIEDGL